MYSMFITSGIWEQHGGEGEWWWQYGGWVRVSRPGQAQGQGAGRLGDVSGLSKGVAVGMGVGTHMRCSSSSE